MVIIPSLRTGRASRLATDSRNGRQFKVSDGTPLTDAPGLRSPRLDIQLFFWMSVLVVVMSTRHLATAAPIQVGYDPIRRVDDFPVPFGLGLTGHWLACQDDRCHWQSPNICSATEVGADLLLALSTAKTSNVLDLRRPRRHGPADPITELQPQNAVRIDLIPDRELRIQVVGRLIPSQPSLPAAPVEPTRLDDDAVDARGLKSFSEVIAASMCRPERMTLQDTGPILR